ncbi:MAG: stage V sporulation protein E [Candidatus Buchananbacteria bacterium CG10_big_fil_rev_8_21_14_0_10_42_9]|uniref:Probable peptidoglycan glycosyltransferase FtsW n=1 Tax=Candidatus Buchananbacteria bacterium CG10_big_fil_rev_8_21_14_0_10_42_9 TaxID=1974526 RepID=A0A2H0W2P2_9BACT|nr:MAG: stage V sporulation protein E [Candidatus Buchananbacteria bacterium CG10_big_fil_rev_8_21_14_0_10_42_9]
MSQKRRITQAKKPTRVKGHNPVKPYFIVVSILVLFGLVMLSSASSIQGFREYNDTYFFFKRQIYFGVIPGIIIGYILYKIPYRIWMQYRFGLLVLTIALLVMPLISFFSAGIGSANSWVSLGGITFQPSEIAKLTFLIWFSAWLSIREEKVIKSIGGGLVPFLFYIAMVLSLIILQPDFGTMTIFAFIALIMFFIGGARLTHLIWLGGLSVLLFGVLIAAAPYRINRFLTFLNPGADPQGAGYHILQAQLAVGSGGLLGQGFGNSIQKFSYLPEVIGDSIFAIIAEELGFIASAGLIMLLSFLMIKGLKLAQENKDQFAKLIVVGIISWWTVQSFINIAAMLSLAPLTGIPLPFISQGGTALMTELAAFGLLANIIKNS